MKKIICLLLFVILICNIVQAQSKNPDSLINILNTQKLTPDKQLSIYEELCNICLKDDENKCILYAKEGLSLTEKKNNNLKASIFNEYIGRCYNVKLSYDTALVFYRKALDLAIKTQNKEQESSVYMNIGGAYYNKDEYTSAIEHYLKAMSYYEITGNYKQCIKISNNLGDIYRILNNLTLAEQYLGRALKIAREYNDTTKLASIYYGLGALYMKKDPNQALEYMLKALESSRANNIKTTEVNCIKALSVMYSRDSISHDKAEKFAYDYLKYAEELNDSSSLSSAWRTLANIYREEKRWKECEDAALKALNFSPGSYLASKASIAATLTIANIQLNNKKNAITFFKLYDNYTGQFTDQNYQEMITEMEVKYETEKKETRITTLEKEKQFYLWLGIAGAAVLLLAFGTLFYRHRLTIQKRKVAEQQREIAEQQRELAEQQVKQLEQEKRLIATQSVLEGETTERSRLARDLHDGLGGLLSVVKLNLNDMKSYSIMDNGDVDRFDKALGTLDESIVELRRVAHHLMPESLMRYGLRVSLEDFCRAIPGASFQYYGSDARLDSQLEILVYRCAYELVNNAVKHSGATAIDVQLMTDHGLVSLTVRDNGRGFDPEKVAYGAGLENIRTRVSAYNGRIHIHTAPDRGSEVSIEIERKE